MLNIYERESECIKNNDVVGGAKCTARTARARTPTLLLLTDYCNFLYYTTVYPTLYYTILHKRPSNLTKLHSLLVLAFQNFMELFAYLPSIWNLLFYTF